MNYEELEKMTTEGTNALVNNLDILCEIIPSTNLSNRELADFHAHILMQFASVGKRYEALKELSSVLTHTMLERNIRYGDPI